VGVSPVLHTDDVLVAFNQGTETTTRLVLVIEGLNVANEESDSTGFLNRSKLGFKPLHVVAGVFSHSPDPPVVGVHRLSVKSNYSSSGSHQVSVGLLEVGHEVPVLCELINGILTNPIYPLVFESVDVDVSVGLLEAFNVHGPSVMITLRRVNGDRSIFESVFNHLSDLQGVVSHLGLSVIVRIVGRVVSSPQHDNWLNDISHMVKHALESKLRQVA